MTAAPNLLKIPDNENHLMDTKTKVFHEFTATYIYLSKQSLQDLSTEIELLWTLVINPD